MGILNGGDNVNEEIDYVLTRMAAERDITFDQMKNIIEEAIHAGATSSDLMLRREMQSVLGAREPSTEEFIEKIARMIDSAHLEE